MQTSKKNQFIGSGLSPVKSGQAAVTKRSITKFWDRITHKSTESGHERRMKDIGERVGVGLSL